MDVSSKYFSLLKRPSPFWIKYFWNFLLAIHRVGKSKELFSFALWEISHRLYIYQFWNRYIKFTGNACLSITPEGTNSISDYITGSFLAENGLCFRTVAVDWKYCAQTSDEAFWGCRYSHLNALYKSTDHSNSAALIYEFSHPITSLFISQKDVLFICSNGAIYKSDDQGKSFKVVLRLSSTISYFLFNNGMTELPDYTLIIGEYGSIWHGTTWQNLAFLYVSTDGGTSWETSNFLIQQGVNKHVHLVKYCALLKSLLLTDGDNKKQLWMNFSLTKFNRRATQQNEGWHLINKYHHQTGGYTSMAETDEVVLFGSDYLGGTNFIVKTTDGKQFKKLVLPDPYRRSPVMNMVTRHSPSGNEIWASSFSCLSDDARSLLMCTKDAGKSWARVIDFEGTKNEVRLISSLHNRSTELYISITEFDSDPNKHQYRVYKLDTDRTSQV